MRWNINKIKITPRILKFYLCLFFCLLFLKKCRSTSVIIYETMWDICLYKTVLTIIFVVLSSTFNPTLTKQLPNSVMETPNHHSRHLLWEPENDDLNNSMHGIQYLQMCPIYINQSENLRLAEELHRFAYLQLSSD